MNRIQKPFHLVLGQGGGRTTAYVNRTNGFPGTFQQFPRVGNFLIQRVQVRVKQVRIFGDSISSQAELDSASNVFFSLPFYTSLLYSADTNVFLFTITLNPEILNSSERQLSVAEIDEILKKYSEDAGVDVHISGHPYIRTEVTNLIKRELLIFTLLAAFVCIIILYIFKKVLREKKS